MRPRDRAGDDLGEPARVLVRVPPLDRDEHVHAVGAARLREAREAERVERLLDEQRDLDVSAKPTSADGSRSKSTKSGRSGLSTREYHVFRSMQPMFTIHSSASSSLTSGESTHFFRAATRASRRGRARVGIQSGMCVGASFWKNGLPSIPSG